MCNTTWPLFLFTTLLSERPVRHTPAFGHPSSRGDGLPHHTDSQSIIKALSRDRCRAIPSWRWEKELPVAVPIAKR